MVITASLLANSYCQC